MVFYEALCPDSKHFIIRQLQPSFYRAPTLVDFQLVPYGKAKVSAKRIVIDLKHLRQFYHLLFQTTQNEDGSLSFDCQHGALECEANIYHACAIEAIQEPKVLLDMVACMIKDNYQPKEAMISCAKVNRIDYEPIQKCVDSPHGAELLKIHGEATNALRPQMTFVPTITLDGYQGRQASILKDLFGEVCKVATGHGTAPDVCT